MEFDSIKPISRTISLCKHLREKEEEREWQSVVQARSEVETYSRVCKVCVYYEI